MLIFHIEVSVDFIVKLELTAFYTQMYNTDLSAVAEGKYYLLVNHNNWIG